MHPKTYVFELLPKAIHYRLARRRVIQPANPITLTFSVTAACQSRCKTCHIGARYLRHPERAEMDLTLEEIERIFQSLGHIYFFNISGGEPFLREELPRIVELACTYLTPGIVHIPTNALLPARIEHITHEIAHIVERHNPGVPLTIKPSIDGVGKRHDEIRGVKGNFKRLEETLRRLKGLTAVHPSLHVELGTVVSAYNIDHLEEIEAYVHRSGVESYRNEIAEQRAEFFNAGDPITPTADQYQRLMARFSLQIREHIASKRRLARITESFRLVYYELVSQIIEQQRQVIPCYAGLSNVHLNFDGELWPCCVLGYDKPMGNLREADYDFGRIFRSKRAEGVRAYIRAGKCHCPLANQAYSNILCNVRQMVKVGKNLMQLL